MKLHSDYTLKNHQVNKLENNRQSRNIREASIENRGLNSSAQLFENYGKYIAFKGSSAVEKTLAHKNGTSTIAARLSDLRTELKKEDLDAIIVRSTDEYLNETVDKHQSQRIFISGFTGSAGDVLITQDKAHLVVDGRYHTQADKEVDPGLYTVEKVGKDKNGKSIEEYPHDRMLKVLKAMASDSKKPVIVGYDPNKFSMAYIDFVKKALQEQKINVELKPTSTNLVDKIRGGKPADRVNPVRAIPISLTGENTESKLNRLREKLKQDNINAMVISNLGDIAYLTNLRGKDIEYSSVFKSKAFITQDKAYVFCNPDKISPEIRAELKDVVEFLPEDKLDDTLKNVINNSNDPLRIAFSIKTTTDATHIYLKEAAKNKASLVEIKENPIAQMRSIKNNIELQAMQDSMNRADRAVADVIEWVNDSLQEGKKITEKDLEEQVKKAHFRHGANDLSFEIIPASGANGAIVHYSHGDPNKEIQMGELVLLDTGGYYDGGYATDLTRTWLAGGEMAVNKLENENPEDLKRKKEIYNSVLLGAVKGLMAELPPDADGAYLDTMVMEPILSRGFEKMHSTGHGIGIVVHESPPGISSGKGGANKLQENMVFSIEPGIYLPDEGVGGVRIENLVTVVPHHDENKAKEGWHEIKCLTFSPLDDNLIDKEFLSSEDKAVLEWIEDFYKEKVEENLSVTD
jgi:Xaa-Pro aminopeptidase